MSELDPDHEVDGRKAKNWAFLRFLLGMAQMMGAVVSFYLLAKTGMSELALAAVAVTCLFTTISVLLFGSRRSR